MKKNLFFIKELNPDDFTVYNSIKHITIKLDKIGKSFFDIIMKYDNDKKEIIKSLPKNKIEEFNTFYESLDNVNFFSLEQDYIEKNGLVHDYSKTKKHFYLHITDRCNLQCKYCYNREYKNSQKDLTLSQWKTIIDKITPYCRKITFTGGEVFLHKSFPKIIEYVKQTDSNIQISVISNGTIDYEKLNIKKTFEAINSLDLNCDNITDDNHLRFGFNKTVFIKNIEYLKKNSVANTVQISSMFTKGDVEEYKDFRRNISIYTNSNKTNDENFCKRKLGICSAANNTFSIDAKGNCFPCQAFHFPEFNLGNILEQNFIDIFNSNIATMLRIANHVHYKDKCKECNLKYLCREGYIANTFQHEGNRLAFPEIMCPYYKNEAISALEEIFYE